MHQTCPNDLSGFDTASINELFQRELSCFSKFIVDYDSKYNHVQDRLKSFIGFISQLIAMR